MSAATEVLQALGGESPGWFVASAVLLALAAAVARRQSASSRSQGKRIGRLEKILALEVVRRRQVEAVLLQDGLRLPWWPEDNTPPARELAMDEDEDLDLDDAATAAAPRITVPPLPNSAALSRHRR